MTEATYVATFTVADVIARVREIAAGDPEHVYQANTSMPGSTIYGMCFYLASTQGSAEACLFGRALTALGVPDEVLSRAEGQGINDLLADIIAGYVIDWSASPAQWLARVQSKQDRGNTWAEAVISADEFYPLPAETYPTA